MIRCVRGDRRRPSQLAWITAGLRSLLEVIHRERVTSIALPPLGCGHGGLDWTQVRPLITTAFTALPDVDVQLFAPAHPRTPPPSAEPTSAGPPEVGAPHPVSPSEED